MQSVTAVLESTSSQLRNWAEPSTMPAPKMRPAIADLHPEIDHQRDRHEMEAETVPDHRPERGQVRQLVRDEQVQREEHGERDAKRDLPRLHEIDSPETASRSRRDDDRRERRSTGPRQRELLLGKPSAPPAAIIAAEARHGVHAEARRALFGNLLAAVRAAGDLDRTHRTGAVRLLELDQRLGQRDAGGEDLKADTDRLRAPRTRRLLRPAGDAAERVSGGEPAAQLGLETHAHDAAAAREAVRHVGNDRVEHVVVVPHLPGVAPGAPVPLGTRDRDRKLAVGAPAGDQIAAAAGEHVDLVAALAAGHGLLDDETAALEAAEHTVGGERMTVEDRVDDVAARRHAKHGEHVQQALLPLRSATAVAGAPLLAPAPVRGIGPLETDEPAAALQVGTGHRSQDRRERGSRARVRRGPIRAARAIGLGNVAIADRVAIVGNKRREHAHGDGVVLAAAVSGTARRGLEEPHGGTTPQRAGPARSRARRRCSKMPDPIAQSDHSVCGASDAAHSRVSARTAS